MKSVKNGALTCPQRQAVLVLRVLQLTLMVHPLKPAEKGEERKLWTCHPVSGCIMFAVASEFSILKELHRKMNPQLISHVTFVSKGKMTYFCLADDGSRLRTEEPTFSQPQNFHGFEKANLRKLYLKSRAVLDSLCCLQPQNPNTRILVHEVSSYSVVKCSLTAPSLPVTGYFRGERGEPGAKGTAIIVLLFPCPISWLWQCTSLGWMLLQGAIGSKKDKAGVYLNKKNHRII